MDTKDYPHLGDLIYDPQGDFEKLVSIQKLLVWILRTWCIAF